MNENFQKYLDNKYIFMNRDKLIKICPDSTYARWGLEINEGWYNILERACQGISEILDKYALPQDTFVLLQCKQKWGKLRMYWKLSYEKSVAVIDSIGKGTIDFNDYSSPIKKEIKEIIDAVCKEASKTCEFCGATNESVSLRQDSWVYTLCDECCRKRMQKIAESKKNK